LIKSYTISSPPANDTLCTVTIKMNKIGAGKQWVAIYNSGGAVFLTRLYASPSDSEQIL
jgi:ferredoxin-NADP reductase